MKYVEHYVDDARTKVKKRQDGALEIELYDLARDPNELDNLALLPASKLGTSAGDVKDREGELAAILHALEKE